jgi:hypothetical protein
MASPTKPVIPQVPDKENILLYFLGYPGVENPVVTNVKGQVYVSPTKEDGSPDIGGTILVDRHDVKEFLKKNTYSPQGDVTDRCAYTPDSSIGSVAARTGKTVNAPSQLTAAEVLRMLDKDTLREALLQKEEADAVVEAESSS